MCLCRMDFVQASRPPRQSLSRLGLLCAGGLALLAPASMSEVRLGVVTGHSMEPTLRSGQPFLFERSSQRSTTLQRGDLVVVQLGGQICIKRVYALAKDRFWSVAPPGRAGSNTSLVGVGDPVNLWKARFPRFEYKERRVPTRCVFVVGDAASQSVDSRQLGPVPESQVVGRVVWPQMRVPPAGGPVAYWVDQPRRPHTRSLSSSSQS